MDSAVGVSYVLLWGLVAMLVLTLTAVLRELALIRRRLGPDPGALATQDGPRIGTAAPRLNAVDLDGRNVDVGEGTALALFLSVTCDVCHLLLPQLERFQRRPDPPRVFAVVRGPLTDVREMVAPYELGNCAVIADSDGAISSLFAIQTTPYGLALDGAWTVRSKGIVNNADHLDALASHQVTHQGRRKFVDATAE